MPRSIALSDHLSSEQLRTRMKEAKTARERTHYQVVYLRSLGYHAPAIAEATGYSQNWVRTLLHRYNALGETGLRDGRADNPGAPPLLNEAQRAELAAALSSPHPDGEGWTGPRVARWIAARTGRKHVYPQQGWAWMKRLGHQ